MTQRQVLQPSPKHPITVEPSTAHVVVTINGETIADTRAALRLQESTYPAVHYIPIADVDSAVLVASATSTYCPYKGDAGYYSVATAGGVRVDDAMWTYREPYPAVAAIAGYVAFYPDKAEVSVVGG